MKVICSMIVTPNGYIADNNGKSVSSQYNWNDFFTSATQYNNFILGRKTLDIVREGLDKVKCDYKIVVSKNKNLALDPSFTLVNSPEEAYSFLKDKVDTLFLVGGGEINTSFAERGLIDELILTIEPHIVGNGKNLFSQKNFNLNLKLLKTETVEGDRVKLTYSVIK